MPSDTTFADKPSLDQSHFCADPEKTKLGAIDELRTEGPISSFWSDAWRALRRRPLFWISVFLIAALTMIALFPGIFTSESPTHCELGRSMDPSTSGHPLGFNRQGCDIWARVIYGARTSMTVGILSALFTALIGATVGQLAGYFGGWLDGILGRIVDIFYAVPIVLASVVVMQVFRDRATALSVVLVISLFAWTPVARVARGAAIEAKASDFVTASKALGLGKYAILLRHILPNSIAPIIVTATTSLGTFIVLEATLSFLGVGLPPSVLSWGHEIANAQVTVKTHISVLLYPAGALALTVLAFILLGDAVRDALDPKSATR
ncbi:MAG: ABC transporter permease [Micrococcales bacterium]|nr:ABC transporter permease [Micrococcales bacterium]